MTSPILQPGRNCWRRAHAGRVAVFDDTASYYEAAATAFEAAQHTITILGWDIHSRVRLRRRDGDRRGLLELLEDQVRDNPALQVRILVWDADVLYAFERETFQETRFRWRSPANIEFCLDRVAPTGASQHQKVVVVDDAIAFVGGSDIAQRRWDTCEHRVDDERRVTPNLLSYGPFHDSQAVVDGEAARALGELTRWRWRCATDESFEAVDVDADYWPPGLRPDFQDVDIALSRTLPEWIVEPDIREVEQLFFDSYAQAQETIYIENQYVSSTRLTQVLAERLAEEGGPEVVIAVPKEGAGWVEQSTMDTLRVRALERLEEADKYDRLRVVYPVVEEGHKESVFVHAKVTAIDDRMLRIGSANMTNRSLGVDTECDLVVEASDPIQRDAVLGVRNRYLGNHLGLSPREVADGIDECDGSLVRFIDSCQNGGQHKLVAFTPSEMALMAEDWVDEELLDPAEPIDAEKLADELLPKPAEEGRSSLARLVVGLAFLGLVAALWHWTPLAEWVDPRLLAQVVEPFSQLWWSPLVAIAGFALFSALGFPVLVLLLATGFVFGSWEGALYGLAGSMLSAAGSFAIGKKLGFEALTRLGGDRVQRVHNWVAERGVWSVVALRLVPLGPFGIVNMIMGASRIRFSDFFLGSLIGLSPGIFLMGIFGAELSQMLQDPSWVDGLIMIGVLIVFVAAGGLVNRYVERKKRRGGGDSGTGGSPLPSEA